MPPDEEISIPLSKDAWMRILIALQAFPPSANQPHANRDLHRHISVKLQQALAQPQEKQRGG